MCCPQVIAYAAARGIEVVPEIELPGHCVAALAAYPHLSCEHSTPQHALCLIGCKDSRAWSGSTNRSHSTAYTPMLAEHCMQLPGCCMAALAAHPHLSAQHSTAQHGMHTHLVQALHSAVRFFVAALAAPAHLFCVHSTAQRVHLCLM
jgi:hypothetical protein